MGTAQKQSWIQNKIHQTKFKTPTLPRSEEEWGTQKARKHGATSKIRPADLGVEHVALNCLRLDAHPSQKPGRVEHPEKIRASNRRTRAYGKYDGKI
jgi:hypothetical protein